MLFCKWQKQSFENDAVAFERFEKKALDFKDCRIAALESILQRKNERLLNSCEQHVQLQNELGRALSDTWVPHDTRDAVIDYANRWSERTELPSQYFIN